MCQCTVRFSFSFCISFVKGACPKSHLSTFFRAAAWPAQILQHLLCPFRSMSFRQNWKTFTTWVWDRPHGIRGIVGGRGPSELGSQSLLVVMERSDGGPRTNLAFARMSIFTEVEGDRSLNGLYYLSTKRKLGFEVCSRPTSISSLPHGYN